MDRIVPTETPVAAALTDWLAACNQALARSDAAAVAALFEPEGHLRDLVALGWQVRTVSGRDAVAALLAAAGVSHRRAADGTVAVPSGEACGAIFKFS